MELWQLSNLSINTICAKSMLISSKISLMMTSWWQHSCFSFIFSVNFLSMDFSFLNFYQHQNWNIFFLNISSKISSMMKSQWQHSCFFLHILWKFRIQKLPEFLSTWKFECGFIMLLAADTMMRLMWDLRLMPIQWLKRQRSCFRSCHIQIEYMQGLLCYKVTLYTCNLF